MKRAGLALIALALSGCGPSGDCDPAENAACVCVDSQGAACTPESSVDGESDDCSCSLVDAGIGGEGGAGGMGGATDMGAGGVGGEGGGVGGEGGGVGGAAGEDGAGGDPGPDGWPDDLPLIDFGSGLTANVEGTFADGTDPGDLSWARARTLGCWENPLTDEFYSQNHLLYGFAQPLPAWHDVTVRVTPSEAQSEANAYLILEGERFDLPPDVASGYCYRNQLQPGPGQPVEFSFRIHDVAPQNALLGLGNRGRWRMDDSAGYAIEVSLTPIAEADRCYADVESPERWPAQVNVLSLNDDGTTVANANLSQGYPVCTQDFLESATCVPRTQFEYFDSAHVFFALDEPLPPQTYATITLIPEPGVDVNLYGARQGVTDFYIPPNFPLALCDASVTPRLPNNLEGPLMTNPGEAESYWIWTGNNPTNLFFAASAPIGANGTGAFTVAVDTLDTSTDDCEEIDYERVRGLESWPNTVEIIDVENGSARVRGTTDAGAEPCTLDWAANSQTACFPATANSHFAGNTVYYAIEAPTPPGSRVAITVTPDEGVDVNAFAYRLGDNPGQQDYMVPPLVPSVGQCEAAYPADLQHRPNPSVPEELEFYFGGRNGYRHFIGVATHEGNAFSGGFTLDVKVTEPPPPNCPESLPGALYPTWPERVTQIELDANGRGVADGDLATGSCVNLDFASTSQVACFPATQFDRFEGNHVFYALAEPMPPRSILDITVTPTDGGEVSVYGLQAGVQNFPIPPRIASGICEASHGFGAPNAGAAETLHFENPSENNSYNIFFAVAGDDATGQAGTFDIEVQAQVGVVHCEESLPGEAIEGDWPASVTPIALDARGNGSAMGDLNAGSCVHLGFASDSNVACFPETQDAQYQGNHVFYRVAEVMPPKSILYVSATPEAGGDINLYGLQRAVGTRELPPRINGGICEASNGHPRQNVGETEFIEFHNPSPNNSYEVLIGVAGHRDGGDAGGFRVDTSMHVAQTHCEESLPGERYQRWPAKVEVIGLDAGGNATVVGDLSDGACTNLGWAASSQTACFPATENDRFTGNHRYFALSEPLPPNTEIEINVDGASVYAFTAGVDSYFVPPRVPITVQCEFDQVPGQAIELNTVANPYNVFIGVAGAEGVEAGAFELNIVTRPRR